MFFNFSTELETNKAKIHSPQLKQNKTPNKKSSLMLTEFLNRNIYFLFHKKHLHMFSFLEIFTFSIFKRCETDLELFFFFLII